MPLLYHSDDDLILACGYHLLLRYGCLFYFLLLILLCDDNFFFALHISSIRNTSQIVEFPSLPENGNIVSFVISSCQSYLIACYTNKQTCCWDIRTRELVGTCQTYKKPTALTLATLPDQPTTEVLLISDKGGELWAMPIPSLSKKVRLFGHTGSVITDTLVTKTLACPHLSILTADRDEKIRVTEFPATFIIQTYLLGHTDVITTLALCQQNSQSTDGYVLSAGWDHRLCLWNKKDFALSDSTSLKTLEETVEEVSEFLDQVPHAEEQPETEENQQEDNDNDQDENRPFDATKAGTFPMRIVACGHLFPSLSLYPIAIICWQSPEIKLYAVENYSDNEGRFHREALSTVISLPAPPVDCLWMESDESTAKQLLVFLPSPYCVQIYSIQLSEGDNLFQYQLLEDDFDGIRNLNDYIRSNGSHFSYL